MDYAALSLSLSSRLRPLAPQLAVCCYLILCVISRTHLRLIAHVAARDAARKSVIGHSSHYSFIPSRSFSVGRGRARPLSAHLSISGLPHKNRNKKKKKDETSPPSPPPPLSSNLSSIFLSVRPGVIQYARRPPPSVPLLPLSLSLALMSSPRILRISPHPRNRAISSLSLLRSSLLRLFSRFFSLSPSHYEPVVLVAAAIAGFSYIFVRPRDVPGPAGTGEARRLLHDGVAQS